jgi:hypothetical protein
MLRIYQSRHPLRVLTIEADGAFKAIRQELQDEPYQTVLSTCDADRHVETIERQIRFVKERIRSVRMMLPLLSCSRGTWLIAQKARSTAKYRHRSKHQA